MAQTSTARKTLPTAVSNGASIADWSDRYGGEVEIPLQSYRQGAAEIGSYFIATNPTPGTGIAMSQSITSYAETAGAVGVYMMIKNTETSTTNNAHRVIMDFIRLRSITTAPTSATNWHCTFLLDNAPNRYTSGGSTIIPVNVSGDNPYSASVVSMYVGALTTAIPSTSKRLLGSIILRAQVPKLMDQFHISFGGDGGGASTVTANAVQHNSFMAPPCVIAPSWQLCMSMWGDSFGAADATFTFEVGWIEK